MQLGVQAAFGAPDTSGNRPLWNGPPLLPGVVESPAVQKEEESDMALTAISVLGVDLGKNVCSVVGLDASGAVVLRRRAKRQTLIALAAKLPPCVVAMEACCGAHHLGRVFADHGHDVGLTSPESDPMSKRGRTTIVTPRGERERIAPGKSLKPRTRCRARRRTAM